MPWVSAVLGVLAAFPKILDLLEKIASAIVQYQEEKRKQKLRDDIDKGIEKAKKEKDTSELEKPFH